MNRLIRFNTISILFTALMVTFFACSPSDSNRTEDKKKNTVDELPITASGDALMLFQNGRDLFDNVRMPEARKFFEDAIKQDSTFAMAYLYRAWSGTSVEDIFEYLDKAYVLRTKASPLEALCIEASFSGYHNQNKEAIRKWETLANKVGKDKRVLNSLAYAYFLDQNYKKSIEALNKSIEIDPEFAANYNSLGYSLYADGQVQKAEEAFKKYIEILPDNEPKPYDTMGDFYKKTGQFDKAIEQYQKAVAMNKRFDHSQHKVAECMIYQGRYDDGRRMLKVAEQLSTSDYNNIWHNAESARSYLHQGKSAKALKRYNEVKAIAESMGLQSYVAHILMDIAVVNMFQAEYQKAKVYLETSQEYIDSSSLDEDVKEELTLRDLYLNSLLYVLQRKFDDAERETKDLRGMAFKNGTAENLSRYYQMKALTCLAKKDYEKAKSELEQGGFEHPMALYIGAKIAGEQGDKPTANQYYQKLVDWNGDDDVFYGVLRPKAKKALGIK